MHIIFNLLKILQLFTFHKNGDVVLNINNSVITFKKEGDIKIKAGRHFINEYDLGFNNCPAHFIEKATIAYSLGNEEYQKFLDKNEQENLPTVEREKCQC